MVSTCKHGLYQFIRRQWYQGSLRNHTERGFDNCKVPAVDLTVIVPQSRKLLPHTGRRISIFLYFEWAKSPNFNRVLTLA
jgi:hypothetical protein